MMITAELIDFLIIQERMWSTQRQIRRGFPYVSLVVNNGITKKPARKIRVDEHGVVSVR